MMNNKITSTVMFLLFISAPMLNGCASVSNPREMTLNLAGKYGETISYLEPQLSTGVEATFEKLYHLCNAYQKLKIYGKFSTCLDRLQNRYDQGDYKVSGGGFSYDYSSALYYLPAQVNVELGNYDKAIEQANKALSLAQNASLPHHKMDSLTTLGLAYALKGKRESALKTAGMLEAIDLGFMFAIANTNKARGVAAINMALGNYEKAVEIMSRNNTSAFAEFAKAGNKAMGISYSWLELPYEFMKYKALFETNKYEEAKPGYDILLGLPRIEETGGIYWQLLADRGRIALHEKQNDQAIEFLKRSIDVIEQQRSSINTDVSKIGFVGDKQSVYRNLIATLIDQEKYDEAFAYAERSKSRALVDMLASKKQFSGGQQEIANLASLISGLDSAEAKSIIQDERSTQQDKSKTRGILVTKKQEIMQVAPELASLVSVTAPDVKELQKLLPINETLIEYYGSGDSIYAFLLSSDGVRGVKLDGKGLAESVTQYRKALIQFNSDQHKSLGTDLYQRLIHPFASGIKTKNITIVPHGVLHYLPFNALFTGNEFVVDKYNVRLLPSASVMKFLKDNQKGQKGSLLALGNPDLGDPKLDLPGAQTEAIAIAKKISGAKVLVRGNATESAVKQNGAGFRYLHLASHGTFDPERPLTSALLLSKDSANDGALTVGELYDLKLNADLVTLSACETALGKIANGDDVVGFTRGFLYAGASSIVSSLWKVDDNATSLLMQEFYSNLQSTNKRDALRAAQLKLKAGKYSHPNYWAAFQLTGSVN
jgi:CHAT domain-containing protein